MIKRISSETSQPGIYCGHLGEDAPQSDHTALWSRRIDVGQDGRFVDVGVVFGVDVLQFRMQRRIAGAGESSITFWDLGKGISGMEVGVVVISWEP